MGKKIYLACSCGKKERTLFEHVAKALREEGFDVYVPFELKIDEKDENGNWKLSQEEWAELVFKKDIAAIKLCDIFLMLSDGRIGSAGKNFEHGFAYAIGKQIIVLQYNNSDISLMTYSGCNSFNNSSYASLVFDAIKQVMCPTPKGKCETVLT